nr:zinc finger, CCHC-type [Tanacetum cinerariifolium]
MMHQLPPETSRQEAIEDLVMNFILDQEERVKQLEEYMGEIRSDFMQLSLKVVEKLKDEIKGEANRVKKIKKITRYPDTKNPKPYSNHKSPESLAKSKSFHAHDLLSSKSLYVRIIQEFEVFDSDVHQGNYFAVSRRPIHPGDVIDWDFLDTHELGWRIGLYSEEESRLDDNRRGLNRSETVRAEVLTMRFWPNIRDGEFVVGGTSVKKFRDPKIRLAYCCIATTISGRKESTHRVTTIDLFFLYFIYEEGVTYNIPYWLARYLKGVRDKDLTCRGMFVTRIARSFGLLTSVMVDALSIEPKVEEDDEVEEAANEEAGGSAEYLSTHDNLDPHLHIDPFPRREVDYPPYGYTSHMPPRYEYRFGPAPGGSE